ncbi:peroxisome proliferator-activated receptor gamma coactivator 1-beta isoform X2 [Syngnathoides biaculeatus]|uniref:peroxisome proliferator-activated receptor gamma coactivator 1-beta isoform X2 n=1 Tax=Syngnathoides biaculeatus TaxID=300417 RepID=UPI002ADE2FF7|nr:peroxisome proliferator-activated receptor gamma coactivator 1-beta isoform X2 [Syngnathoides biaculeatus]
MADCAPLLDEELSSFVFSYLTENPDGQYGEEEVCSDRLDSDFADIDLSQLDTSDFDSVNCLGELQWCSDQAAGASPASIRYSTPDELFEIEEENAALLAALTDSLDGMVDAEVGGLSVFPALEEEEPEQDTEDQDHLRHLSAGTNHFKRSQDPEDPSLLKILLLTPPNVPAGKDGVHGHRHSNRGLHQRTVRPPVKMDTSQMRKPRTVRPAGRLCTELHRHLTTALRDAVEAPTAETEDDEEDEDDEDSESEEDDDDEEEEEESSGSEVEGRQHEAPAEPAKPQFTSEKELRSIVDLITYMHTYCMPMRKQQSLDRKDPPRPRARADVARPPVTNSHSRVVLVAPPASARPGAAPRRLPFVRRREMKTDSLLRELLQQSSSFDVRKPYGPHCPPYTQAATGPLSSNRPPGTGAPKLDLCKDHSSPERRHSSCESPQSPAEDCGSFSVRRSRRLASFPSRFAKRSRPGRPREGDSKEGGGDGDDASKLSPTQAGGRTTTEAGTQGDDAAKAAETCCHSGEIVPGGSASIFQEKRACLCLPLDAGKSTREFSGKTYEQTLCVDLCGTAGLTPPTTPPHKLVEDDLFKPGEARKVGESFGDSEESVHTSVHSSSGGVGGLRGSWLNRTHQRKLPEQTELYAQLRRMGQAGDADARRGFGDHDYCALSLGETRKRSIAVLGAMLQRAGDLNAGDAASENSVRFDVDEPVTSSPPPDRQSAAATPPASEEEAERSAPSRSPSPTLHVCPDSPASKADSSEHSEMCPDDEQSGKAKSEENCQVFYIHNLPSSMTQNTLRKRFQVFGTAEDCKVIICNEERCGVIKIRQSGTQRHRRERENVFQTAPAGGRRLTRKRYIDLDEAGPGPVKSKYDALDFDALMKEAQKSLHHR